MCVCLWCYCKCVVQVGVDAGNEATRGQDEGDEGQEQGGSVQGILEGSAVRPGADLDAESSVNSLLGSALGIHLCYPYLPLHTGYKNHGNRQELEL